MRSFALIVVVALPGLGLSGIASARTAHPAKGTAAWCATHGKRAICKNAGGAGGGTGGSVAGMTLTALPNPLVEVGESEVHAVLQISTSPAYAGDFVLVESSQLDHSCVGPILPGAVNTGAPTGITFLSISAPGGSAVHPAGFAHEIAVVLDDDGNAALTVVATDCAPGSDVISADLEAPPYVTALTTLVVSPPNVTPEGVSAYPTSEVETGDTPASGESDIYAVFYVETSPVYAEQPVTISSSQLQSRCGDGWLWSPGNMVPSALANEFSYSSADAPGMAETTLDDDGNAVFVFYGASCAAGLSDAIAEIDAGTHSTYVTTFMVNAPTAGSSGPPVT